jgi:hypothetical protein
MPITRPRSRFAGQHLFAATVALLLAACVGDSVTLPVTPGDAPALGKAPSTGGPTVTSTLPKSGEKGQTLDVHVYGTGFTAGATATWALHGVADPSKVKTNSTTFVSSTELIANITIAPDATIDYWDVQVAAAFCCKTGVGTEMFEVTTAMPVGPGVAFTVNDLGDIAGEFGGSGSTANHAYVVSGENASFSDLGLQQVRAISQDGRIAVGGIGSGIGQPIAAVWTRAAGAAWPLAGTKLPDPSGTTFTNGRANGVATLSAENVTLIAGIVTVPSTAVYWESTDGTWTSPARLLPIPAGYVTTNNSALAMAANGDIAGQLNDPSGNSVAVVWRRVTGGYVADLLPRASGYAVARLYSISPDGTILGGNVRVSSRGKDVLAPAFWTRDATGVYTVQRLPTLTGADATDNAVAVYGVTVVGGQVRAVGTSPSLANGTYLHAVSWTWTVGGSDFVVRDIGGVGTRTDVFPYAINAAGTIAVGGDGTGSIKWLMQP